MLKPQDGREEHGLNPAQRVAKRAPDPHCSLPQHQRKGCLWNLPWVGTAERGWWCITPQTRYRLPKSIMDALKGIHGERLWSLLD